MLAASFCQSPPIEGRVYSILTTINVKLLAASALLVQSGALLVIYKLFRSCQMLSQSNFKSAVHQHADQLFQQHCRRL
jgi:hypothetical protein